MRLEGLKISNHNLRIGEQYYRVENYAMKCRLYPNKDTASKIDLAIQGIQSFYNCTLYEMFTNKNLVTEKQKKSKDKEANNELVHFPDFKSVGSVEWKHKMIEEHPIINNAPMSAITCKTGIITDMKKSLGKLPIEYQKPQFYNKKHPRHSYSYQETYGKIKTSDNQNVIYIDLAKIGLCKVRGWNKRIRFDENGEIDFREFCTEQKKNSITVNVSKDNCGDYWIVFKLPYVYTPKKIKNENIIGVDVGIKDIAITSDGIKYENKRFKEQSSKHEERLHKQLSRRQGFSNIKFREKYKSDRSITVSAKYEDTKLKLARLNRKVAWKRDNYNHNITTDIVNNSNFIGVESLNVKGMFKNHCLAKALSDASMGSVLSTLKYKSDWYGRVIQPIDQWTPSSKRCSCCGYVRPKLSLATREWTCPECDTHHDRDINAAKNIKHFAYEIYINNCCSA